VKYIKEYRNKVLIDKLLSQIYSKATGSYSFMEVCGGHTMAIHRFGIPSLLPGNINLLSGPGCPVCVTSVEFIDKAIEYAHNNFVLATYGDLIRVPGSYSSLEKEKASGKDIRIVYSLLDALTIARENPKKQVVFLGIGFETTAPGTAVGIVEAKKQELNNFMVLSSHKLMPPAMEGIIEDGIPLDGYLCPGHVSTITGSEIYRNIPEKYGLGCVIAGFEPVDILQSILMLIEQMKNKTPSVEIQYKRAVKPAGNPRAREYMSEVFEEADEWWRGLGILKNSGMQLKEKYRDFDAASRFPVDVNSKEHDNGCICGEILKGKKQPTDCPLFESICNPENPVGACMVSSEGACQAFYKYKDYE